MKAIKTVGKGLLWAVVVIVALILALPLWIGPVVRPIANAIVPGKTGTSFNLGELGLNQYNGRLSIGDLQLGNPEGCKQKMAFTLGKLLVDVDMGSLSSDTIVVEELMVTDLFVSYVSNDKGENNFAVIQRNVTGDKKESKAKASDAKEQKPTEPTESKPAKKVVIDHLKIEKILVQLGPVPIPLPGFELNGIGRKTNGVTLAEAWKQIYEGFVNATGSTGAMFKNLGKDLSDGAAKQVNNMTDAIKGGANIVNEATGKTMDTVGESAGKAVNVIKGLFN